MVHKHWCASQLSEDWLQHIAGLTIRVSDPGQQSLTRGPGYSLGNKTTNDAGYAGYGTTLGKTLVQ